MGAPRPRSGGGPLFGFDGDARACRTTHQRRPARGPWTKEETGQQRRRDPTAPRAAVERRPLATAGEPPSCNKGVREGLSFLALLSECPCAHPAIVTANEGAALGRG